MKDSGFGAGWHAGSALIGVFSGLALGAMFGMWFGPDVIGVEGVCEGSVVWCFLYTWQTLIAGFLAVVGAAVGAYLLCVQIEQQREQANIEKRRRSEIAVLQLPHALTKIHEFVDYYSQVWKSGEEFHPSSSPNEAIDRICVICSDINDRRSDDLRHLLRCVRTFDYRMRSAMLRAEDVGCGLGRFGIGDFWNSMLLDLIEIYIMLDEILSSFDIINSELNCSNDIEKYLQNIKIKLGVDIYDPDCGYSSRILCVLEKKFPRDQLLRYPFFQRA